MNYVNKPTFSLGNTGKKGRSITVGNGIPKLIVIIGYTDNRQSLDDEIDKVRIAEKFGASMIADVSTEGNIALIHQRMMSNTLLPLSTVPLYEIYQQARVRNIWNAKLPKSLVLDVIESQAERGVDCMTLHSSYTRAEFEHVNASTRRISIQARGGGMIHELFKKDLNENPLFEYFEDILDILSKYGVVASLGSCLRSGTVDDPIDDLNSLETLNWSILTKAAINRKVPVMVEGGSHFRYEAIRPYIHWVRHVCEMAPIRLLGPLSTEVGLGYDHITAAITAVEAFKSGVELLSVVTRAEHIGIPSSDDLREALVGYRIASHISQQHAEYRSVETSFTCGLGFHHLKSTDFIDLERAVEQKMAKSNGTISACYVCSESCRMKLSSQV